MKITPQDALIVVDLQNDFCPGGALAVPGGDEVIPMIHQIAGRFDHIILTQDWHPPGHCSFQSSGTGGPWPEHCVQGTHGADFHPDLRLPQAELILRKGFRKHIDSYSAFFENDRTTPTGLAGYCRERDLRRIFLVGLAYDFCVGYSAIDAERSGFEAVVIRDACRAIDRNDSVPAIESEFNRGGVLVMESVRI